MLPGAEGELDVNLSVGADAEQLAHQASFLRISVT
jgi:hypothetical protein